MLNSEQNVHATFENGNSTKIMLNAAEQKLKNETGCKYGLRDCLYRMVHPKCFKCKQRSEYEWDYTIDTV